MKLWRWFVTAWLVAIFPFPIAFSLFAGGSVNVDAAGFGGFLLLMAVFTVPVILACLLALWLMRKSSRGAVLLVVTLVGVLVPAVVLGAAGSLGFGLAGALTCGGAALLASWLEYQPQFRWPARLGLGVGAVIVLIVGIVLAGTF